MEASGNAPCGSRSVAGSSAQGLQLQGPSERREGGTVALFQFDCRQERTNEDSLEHAVLALDLEAKERGQTHLGVTTAVPQFFTGCWYTCQERTQEVWMVMTLRLSHKGVYNLGKVTLWRGLGIHASQGNDTSPLQTSIS